jgi:DNA invertase Pin-like site-specific DNA recombinase
MNEKVTTVIEKTPFEERHQRLKRVAAYARVSTKLEEQESSLDLQVYYFAKEILFNPSYTFAGIYYDHGKSGTSMDKRKGLQDLLQKAFAGKVDLILVKSLSRFARNTLDALKVIKELRAKGVEFFFEKENISSMDPKIDLLLSILAGLAEVESKQIGSNIRWSVEKNHKAGKVQNRPLLGYRFLRDGTWVIEPSEAKVIQSIYTKYLEKTSQTKIKDWLIANGHKTLNGSLDWSVSSISAILRNEKYMGDVLLGKSVSTPLRPKNRQKNTGERSMYHIHNHHEGIIISEMFQKVQNRFQEKKDNTRIVHEKDVDVSRFVRSNLLKKFLYRKTGYTGSKQRSDLLANESVRNPLYKPIYVEHALKVVLDGINALRAKFSEIEPRFDLYVQHIMATNGLKPKIEEKKKMVAKWKIEYDELSMAASTQNADHTLLMELEKRIIEDSICLVEMEDEYETNYDYEENVRVIKKKIAEGKEPLASLDEYDFKSIFCNMVILDNNEFGLIINTSNKKLNPADYENLYICPPLIKGVTRFKKKTIDIKSNWEILVI